MLSPHGFAPQLWPGFTPYEVSKLIVGPDILERLSRTDWPRFWRIWDLDEGLGWLTIFSIMSLLIYMIVAALFTWDTMRRFEIVAGRAEGLGERGLIHQSPTIGSTRESRSRPSLSV